MSPRNTPFIHVLADEHTSKELAEKVANSIDVSTDEYEGGFCFCPLSAEDWRLHLEHLNSTYDERGWDTVLMMALWPIFEDRWRYKESVESYGARATAEEFADWLIGHDDRCPLIIVDEATTEEVHFPALVQAIRKRQHREGHSPVRVFIHMNGDPRTVRELIEPPVTTRKIQTQPS